MKSDGKTDRHLSTLQTAKTFLRLGTCSETLVNVLNRACGNNCELEERASIPLAGGILQRGYQCGMLWGAALAAGAEIYRKTGSGPQAEALAVETAGRLVAVFRGANCAINCREITGVKWQSPSQIFMYFLKGGPLKCIYMSTRYAKQALNEIESSLPQEHLEAPTLPISCAAEVTRRMGASEMQILMSAGFAGGIGLCGAACGALGAAVWMLAMDFEREGAKDVWKSEAFKSKTEALIARFLEASGGKMECAEICGRNFATVAEHADHLRNGGCAKIIDALTEN